MKKRLVSIALILAALVAVSSVYFIQNSNTKIYGSALVLAFVSGSDRESLEDLQNIWGRSDLTIELIQSCSSVNEAKLVKCISQNIQKATRLTEKSNKPLLLLTDTENSQALLLAVSQVNQNSIAASIFLQPSIDLTQASRLNVSRVLVVSDGNDPAENIVAARRTASKARQNGQWAWSTLLYANTDGLLFHPVLPQMTSYLIDGYINPVYKKEFDSESRWQQPIVDNQKFFEQKEMLETRPVDRDVQRILKAFYAYDLNLLKQWPLKEFTAFNLTKYRDSLPENKRGRYATFMNRKGHKFYMDMQVYAPYEPEFVIAIGDETNLYRMTSFYITKRFYSWDPDGPSEDMLYSQSLGAFLHFKNPPPANIELPYLQYSSILFDSIEFSNQNPYKDFNNLSPDAFDVLTLNCVPCHSVNGVGGAAHHVDYRTLQPQPGFAKPLLTYPKQVLDNFFYNQPATAKLIGVNINYVDPVVGKELENWLLTHEGR